MKTATIQTGVWLDGKKAIIITLVNGQESILEINADIDNPVHHKHQGKPGSFFGDRHINDETKFENKKRHEIHQYLEKVFEAIGDTDELLIMGPSEIKHALKKRIEDDKSLGKKLRSMESADYLTLNQTVAHVKKFFQVADTTPGIPS